MNLKVRLALLNFLEFAVWGAYLTSMGTYLGKIGMASQIGWFYAVQGVVSIFMPALMGIVADRWVPAQRLLGFCHLMAALFMFGAAYMGMTGNLGMVFWIYTLSVAFYMPTLALTNSVSYNALTLAGDVYGKRLSSDSCVWYGRFHLYDVVCRLDGIPAQSESVCCFWCGQLHSVPLYLYVASMSCQRQG